MMAVAHAAQFRRGHSAFRPLDRSVVDGVEQPFVAGDRRARESAADSGS